jgi:hypothetical protein
MFITMILQAEWISFAVRSAPSKRVIGLRILWDLESPVLAEREL